MYEFLCNFVNKNYLLFTILAAVLAIPAAYVTADTYFGFEYSDSQTDGDTDFLLIDDVAKVATFVNGTVPYAVTVSPADHSLTVINLEAPTAINTIATKIGGVGAGGQDSALGPQIVGANNLAVWTNSNGTYAAVVSNVDDAIQILDLSGVAEGHIETHWNYTGAGGANNEYGRASMTDPYDVTIFQNVSANGEMGPVALVASFGSDSLQAFNLRDLDDATSLQGIVPVGNITNNAAAQKQLQGNLVLDGPTGIDHFYVDDVPYAIVTSFTENGFQVLTLRDALNQTGAYRGGGITVPHNATGPTPYANATDGGDQGYDLLGGVIDVATWNVTVADPVNDTYPKSMPYAIMVSHTDDALIIVDLQDPTFSSPNTISASQLFNSTDGSYFTALEQATSVETMVIGDRNYALITSNATAASGVTLIDLYNPSNPVVIETIIDGETDDDTGSIYDELDDANGVAHFYRAPYHYAIAVAGGTDTGDDGIQVIQLTGDRKNTGNALICGISQDCTAPSITTYGNSQINDGFSINGNTLENQKKYNDENDTITSSVGKLVTLKARVYDAWSVNSIEKINIYFDMSTTNWDDANAGIKYLVQRDEVSTMDNNDIFDADASSKVVTNPYGNDSSLKMMDVTFKIMFTGSMETSNIAVQSIDSEGNYSIIYFNDILEIVDQSTGATPTSGDAIDDEVIQTTASVPAWVKNTAAWWADGAISEGEFVNAIEHLVKTGTIIII